jgi:hypothetical protein
MSPSEASSVSSWKQKKSTVLTVPSGETCLAHKRPLQGFLKAGVIPNSLMPIILQWMKKAQGGKTTTDLSQEIDIENTQQVTDMLDLIDIVVIDVVDEPKVNPVPKEEDPDNEEYDPNFKRDDETLYVDDLQFDDKVFIYGWALGGIDDLATFLQEQQGDVGAVSDGEKSENAPERVGSDR